MKYQGTPCPIQNKVEQFHEMFTENTERPKTISIVVQTQKLERIILGKDYESALRISAEFSPWVKAFICCRGEIKYMIVF